jgi:hypothetical protein
VRHFDASQCRTGRHFVLVKKISENDCQESKISAYSAPRHPEKSGQMSEWSNEHAWKACVAAMLPRVRIPLCPPFFASVSDYEWQAIVAKKEAKNVLRSSQSEVGRPVMPFELRCTQMLLCTTLTFCAQLPIQRDSITAKHQSWGRSTPRIKPEEMFSPSPIRYFLRNSDLNVLRLAHLIAVALVLLAIFASTNTVS